MPELKHLFSPFSLGPLVLRNRIMSTGHQTNMVEDGLPTPPFLSYHRARARGGVGLIVLEAGAVTPEGVLHHATVRAFDERIVPAYRAVGEAVHSEGAAIGAQLFAGGREVASYVPGFAPAAPSPVPSQRYHVLPRELELEEIAELVEGYARSAGHMRAAGFDLVEVVGSHGYLPAQFWSARTNRRHDAYGGSLEARCRFTLEVLRAVRARVGAGMVVGLRMSGDEVDGATEDELQPVAELLARSGLCDYISLVAGSSATYMGSVHIVPPALPQGYLEPMAMRYREIVGEVPLMLANRVHDPEVAERLLAVGAADVLGMNRALISDPDMPRKAQAGKLEDIWRCIGCNQGCIGHYHIGLPIACLQNPATGREDELGDPGPAPSQQRVLVVGGGPAGMQAAAVAARRGHQVTLWERGERLGGKIPLIVGGLPERADFGLLLGHQVRELGKVGVEVVTSRVGDAQGILGSGFEVVVLAVGAVPYWPDVPGMEAGRARGSADDRARGAVLPVEEALLQPERVGARVVVVDWRGDAPAAVAALRLARDGHAVTVVAETLHPCEGIHQYLRNLFTGWLLKAGVDLQPQLKLVSLEPGTAVVRQIFSGAEQRLPADTVVLSCGGVAETGLYRALKGKVPELYRCGDANGARSAEDAILEAHRTALQIGVGVAS